MQCLQPTAEDDLAAAFFSAIAVGWELQQPAGKEECRCSITRHWQQAARISSGAVASNATYLG